MKIGPGVSEMWGGRKSPSPIDKAHMAYITACTTVQAVMSLLKTVDYVMLSYDFYVTF